MVTIKYPKFVQTGQRTDVPACPTTTAVAFSFNFDSGNIPVVVCNLSSTCGWARASNATTAGFNISAQYSGTAEWIAIYQSV